jgi:hypothetical protein
MTTLALIGFKRSRRRAILKISPYFVYAGLVVLSLGIIGMLSVLSLSV